MDCRFESSYARSGRSRCKKCEEMIEIGSQRFSHRLKSNRGKDGYMDNWYHPDCFWPKFQHRVGPYDIRMDSLRSDDRQKIISKIQETSSTSNTGSTASKKRKCVSVGGVAPRKQIATMAARKSIGPIQPKCHTHATATTSEGSISASSRFCDRPSHRWEGGSTTNMLDMTDGSTGSKKGSLADDASGSVTHPPTTH